MALLTDDLDLETSFFRIITGGNGDYYPQIIYKDYDGINHTVGIRVAMSGGHASTRVKLAVVELYRALEEAKLNEHPLDEPERWPNKL
jgi:hypothetical protein